MVGINSFLANPLSSTYVTQLFTSPGSSQAGEQDRVRINNGTGGSYEPGAAERALARIVSILSGLEGDGTPAPKVDETSGYIMSATGTSDADKMDLKAIGLYHIDTGAGDDTVNIKGKAVTDVQTGDGNDTLNIAARAAMDINTGAGDDVVNYAGEFAMGIDTGEGNDTLRLKADSIVGLSGGAGDDAIAVEGKNISISGGTGNDTVTITAKGDKPAEYLFAAGDGRDTIKTNAPLTLRFAPGKDGTSYSADDLDVKISGNTVTVQAKTGTDQIAVSFDDGWLNDGVPKFKFDQEHGALVLKIS